MGKSAGSVLHKSPSVTLVFYVTMRVKTIYLELCEARGILTTEADLGTEFSKDFEYYKRFMGQHINQKIIHSIYKTSLSEWEEDTKK